MVRVSVRYYVCHFLTVCRLLYFCSLRVYACVSVPARSVHAVDYGDDDEVSAARHRLSDQHLNSPFTAHTPPPRGGLADNDHHGTTTAERGRHAANYTSHTATAAAATHGMMRKNRPVQRRWMTGDR